MSIPSSLRLAVIERDGPACRYCGAILGFAWQPITLDHLTPRVRGGLDTLENLVVSCIRCNTSKSDMTLEESGRILFPPRFFDLIIDQAKEYLASLGPLPQITKCPICGLAFNALTTYEGKPCAARRMFCSPDHGRSYTVRKTLEKAQRRQNHVQRHPNDIPAQIAAAKMPNGPVHK